MLVFTVDQLRATATTIFRAAGAEIEPTAVLVDHLIDANLAGHDSHGILRIPSYVESMQRGQVQPNAQPTILRETPTSALVDGTWGFGHVAARFATDVAIAKAKTSGVSVVGIVRCNHIGRLGTYPTRASSQGVALFVTVGGLGPSVAPFGGARGAMGTNPLSFGFPAADRHDVLIDFATSAIAGGKVMAARAKHAPVPEGTLVDEVGNPTTDPNALFSGGHLLPFGAHKGSALAVMTVLLSQALIGSSAYADGLYGGVFLLAINAGLFRDIAAVQAETDYVVERIKATPPAVGFDEVLVPGEPEVRAAEQRRAGGIEVAEDTWKEIIETARSLGVTVR